MTDPELETLCNQYAYERDCRDEADARRDEIGTQIGVELALRGANKAAVGAWACAIVRSERKSLSRLKLIELGIPSEILDQATDVTASSSVRVNRRGQADQYGTKA